MRFTIAAPCLTASLVLGGSCVLAANRAKPDRQALQAGCRLRHSGVVPQPSPEGARLGMLIPQR